ncbi:Two-component response regulator-like PRR1 [Morella rubra]|uniref:Two-component response regulator-like PRR1 n=1 Tax=Morella rubra TaxID=262757 RepID=A0A6A1VYX1_9ROSI|nr:Two-component response regulator-like PRR1 [Morella rubra]
MERKELNLNRDCGAGNNCKGGDGFIDRSKVRILLCDNDSKSLEEVMTLLLKCSYQVTAVRSARQVIDALNAEGANIDIILGELDLPLAKGMKMLKYINRDKELRRIPVIMMSAQDEVSIVVKCLRLGAADYLVKPLRTNELLNLWTHMWRRRHMLGLAEKNILNYDFDQAVSDPSDANTNSTTLFSDDTDDKSSRSTNPEIGLSIHLEDESVTVEPPHIELMEYRPDVPGISDRITGQFPSGPKKSELKIGESSAFFTYVKSGTRDFKGEKFSQVLSLQRNEHKLDVSGLSAQAAFPYCIPGVVNQVMMPPAAQFYQKNAHDLQSCAPKAMIPPYHHLQQCPPHVNGMAPFPYYPINICLQPGQMPPHSWSSIGSSSSPEVKLNKVDRREAALIKFRQKRKERCFDKKIRYVNRKRLAERRPRVRGQFVRKGKWCRCGS